MQAISLLQRAIHDTCMNFYPVPSLEEAETVITLEALQKDLLKYFRKQLTPEEKQALTLSMLKSELVKNNLYSTTLSTKVGTSEVWLVRKKAD